MYVLMRGVIILSLCPLLAGITACTPSAPPSGTYTVDTFQFVLSKPTQNVGEAIPNVWIDTNMKLSSLSGGTLTSSLPGSVKIDYTDNSFEFKEAVFTSLKITYDDDTVDLSSKAAKLPLRIAAREYEAVNSVAGGQIVKTKCWIISGAIPDVVTRAKPLRLQIDGHFTKSDGNKIPFEIDQRFDIEKENAVKSAEEVLQDK